MNLFLMCRFSATESLRKLIMVMSVNCLLTFVVILNVIAAPTYSQDVGLDVKMKHTTVRDILKFVENQSGYRFFFSDDFADINKRISIDMETTDINELLSEIFQNSSITYKMLENNTVVITPVFSAQQGIAVTGTVTDADGIPIPGVNVVLKGTLTGTVSDINGAYNIHVPDTGSELLFSFVGYLTQSVVVGNNTSHHITMHEDARQIEEVVVVGYGTQKKVNLTGAVSAVSGDDLVKRPVSNPATMLQGQIPGLSIVQGVGQPGAENASIRIRGQGSYSSAGSDPLVLIDGVPGSLSTLNANDIESISVLKDASSASIYGARAANGVILVTTKSGKDGVFKLTYDLNIGIHNPTRMLKLVHNSADYMRLSNEAKNNSGIAGSSNTYTDEMIALYDNATDRNKYPNFDWMDYAFSPALVQNHNLALSGGAKGTTYNITLGYINQPGTMKGFEFEKYNFRTNIKSQLKDWITVGTNIFLERGDVHQPAQGQGDAFLSFLSQAPTYGPKLPDGSGYASSAYNFEDHNKNMGAITDNGVKKNSVSYDVSAQLWVELKLAKGLTWYSKGAANFTDLSAKTWRPVVPLYNYLTGDFTGNLDVGENGLVVENGRTFYTNLFSYLKYEITLAEKHNIGVQFGYSQEYNRYENLRGYRKKYMSDLQELDAGTEDIQTAKGYAYEWALMSLFGRLNYDYKGRYLLEMNVRYDGTSRIAEDKRWGVFPSFSAGWRVSEEAFMKNLSASWLNNLKIRGSYGLLGNQNVNVDDRPYPYQSILKYEGAYPFDNNELSAGVAQTGYSNKDIKWESTSIGDIGVDITLFKGLSISYDWYRKNTTDILRGAQVASLLGLSAPIINSGAMVNSGNEVSIQYNGRVEQGNFKEMSYGAGVYFNKYKNETKKFGAEEISNYYIRQNGLPYNSYYMLECVGIFQTPEEIAAAPKQFSDKVQPGDLKYKDANDDGVVDNDDRVVIQGKFPKYEYSFNAFAAWKGFDISAFFQGVKGRKIFVNGWGYEPFRQGTPPTTDWLTDRWTGPGTSNSLPRITYDYYGNSQNRRNSTWFLQDASYFRLKNLTIGYSLPKNIVSRIRCEKVRVYFSGDNLFTITNFKGLDPERGDDGSFAQYPQNKIISFGLNVEF